MAALVWPAAASGALAQTRPLTLPDVLTRARERAPQVVSAQLLLAETRARLPGASRRTTNPEIDIATGNRDAGSSRYTEFEVGVAQALEPARRRQTRVDGVQASVAARASEVEEATRLTLREAAAGYYRAVHAQERIRLLAAARDLARTAHATADRRFRAGEIAILDVNVARIALARVEADQEAAEAATALVLGDLAQLLGLEDVAVEGTLVTPEPSSVESALRTAADRPELRVLAADIQQAEAAIGHALTYTRPEYGLAARYTREEGDHIVLGGLRITLPLVATAQEPRDVASAQAARLRTELVMARTRIESEVRSAHTAYSRRLNAVRVLERDALPTLDENTQLNARSFDVGQIGLPEMLLVQREILEARLHYLDALLEAALARVELDARAGVLR